MNRRTASGSNHLLIYINNVNGLSSRSKFQQCLRWAGASPYHIIALLDHRLSLDPLQEEQLDGQAQRIAPLWTGPHFFSAGTSNHKGILLLLHPNAPISNATQFMPQQSPDILNGRWLRLDFVYEEKPISFHCLYAPAQPALRTPFFEALHSHAFAGRTSHILGGDFNAILKPLDTSHRGARRCREEGSLVLQSIIQERGLVDVWRRDHGSEGNFTHFAASSNTGARLDYFLASADLASTPGTSSEILPSAPIATDHSPVIFSLVGPPLSPPPMSSRSRWHFPTHLLDNPDCLDQFRAFLVSSLPPVSSSPHPTDAWLAFKSKLQTFATRLGREFKAAAAHELAAAQQAVDEAKSALTAALWRGDPESVIHALSIGWRTAVESFVGLYRKSGRAHQDVDAAILHLNGGRASKVYHSLARPPHLPTHIARLHNVDAPVDASDGEAADLSTISGLGRASHTFLSCWALLYKVRFV